jgi:hypothetical protein
VLRETTSRGLCGLGCPSRTYKVCVLLFFLNFGVPQTRTNSIRALINKEWQDSCLRKVCGPIKYLVPPAGHGDSVYAANQVMECVFQ